MSVHDINVPLIAFVLLCVGGIGIIYEATTWADIFVGVSLIAFGVMLSSVRQR